MNILKGRITKECKTVTARMEAKRKSGRPQNGWTGGVEEDLKTIGSKQLAYSCHRSEGMEEDCIGNQGPKCSVVPEEKKKALGRR